MELLDWKAKKALDDLKKTSKYQQIMSQSGLFVKKKAEKVLKDKRQNLKSLLIHQAQVDKVIEGYFFLIKTTYDSFKYTAISVTGEDLNGMGMRFGLYN